MTATTTLKLSPELKARIATLAKQTGRTPHRVMIEALERQLERVDRMRAFAQEALEADAEIDRTGEMYSAEDVHGWLECLATNRKAKRPNSS